MTTLKLTQVGNSLGVVLPKQMAVWLNLEEGDMFFVTDAANEAMRTPCDKAFRSQMAPR